MVLGVAPRVVPREVCSQVAAELGVTVKLMGAPELAKASCAVALVLACTVRLSGFGLMSSVCACNAAPAASRETSSFGMELRLFKAHLQRSGNPDGGNASTHNFPSTARAIRFFS
jgi:hypothetical protein